MESRIVQQDNTSVITLVNEGWKNHLRETLAYKDEFSFGGSSGAQSEDCLHAHGRDDFRWINQGLGGELIHRLLRVNLGERTIRKSTGGASDKSHFDFTETSASVTW